MRTARLFIKIQCTSTEHRCCGSGSRSVVERCERVVCSNRITPFSLNSCHWLHVPRGLELHVHVLLCKSARWSHTNGQNGDGSENVMWKQQICICMKLSLASHLPFTLRHPKIKLLFARFCSIYVSSFKFLSTWPMVCAELRRVWVCWQRYQFTQKRTFCENRMKKNEKVRHSNGVSASVAGKNKLFHRRERRETVDQNAAQIECIYVWFDPYL